MEFKNLSILQKWYLKYTDKPAYKKYKSQLHAWREEESFKQKTVSIRHPLMGTPDKPVLSFKHSGNSGDIIYSLPAVFELAKNAKVRFYLNVNQPAEYYTYHPLGNVMLNDKMADGLIPLLEHQPQIEAVEKFNGETVDFDLDQFRKYSFPLDRGSILRWYFNVYGISADTSKPYLTAPKDKQYADWLVIARSHRYHMPLIDYGFLKKYPNKVFLGVPEEYKDMKSVLPDLEFKPVNNFLEMATIINSCKLFIGNQSFPFAIAEALKVNRLLEVYYKAPNVIVEGTGGNDFMYQPQFEYSVERLLQQTIL
ncbi:MAG TPA: hypothetical protein VF609_13080 [Flavisolibacter sp.]